MPSPSSIGICLGDITGIGPEVALKAIEAEIDRDDARYVLIGDSVHAKRLGERLRVKLSLEVSQNASASQRVVLCSPNQDVLPPDLLPGSPESARASVEWVRAAAELCLNGKLDAMVTAPVNKESIVRAGISFVGQTEMLSELAGTKRTAMMLLGADDRGRWLRVALATTHVPLSRVAGCITRENILTSIELSVRACRDLGLDRARIGVCGLNPHAGEGGKIGTEELVTIAPAVKAAQERHIDAVGPLSADALFYHAFKGQFDVVIAMYHDQGLVPLKMVAFEQGVNWTLGLPFIRTSPDHGTAYDIAGQGIANPSSMIAAIRLAKQLAAKRKAV